MSKKTIINNEIFLPGLNEQLKQFLKHIEIEGKKILVVGGETEIIAQKLYDVSEIPVEIIVDDDDLLANLRYALKETENISVKLMEYENTDYAKHTFDIIYAQASISRTGKGKILKEFRKILKPDGMLCIGEPVLLREDVPTSITEILQRTNQLLTPLEKFEAFYTERKFEVLHKFDLHHTIKKFYSKGNELLKKKKEHLEESEKKQFKKDLNQLTHETNLFSKHGGDKYIGYSMIIARSSADEKK